MAAKRVKLEADECLTQATSIRAGRPEWRWPRFMEIYDNVVQAAQKNARVWPVAQERLHGWEPI
ncbi:uncharacterized protein METZ01_LOCUS46414 [marine metagenome]|uniref:Uncharacterized protein n=1 Tax=marine metagenome TaxID=408172 RepID=A0A381RNW6_9ZZZZ